MRPTKSPALSASQRVNLVADHPVLGHMVFPGSFVRHQRRRHRIAARRYATDYQPEKEEKVLFEMLSWRFQAG
jgi:LacI family gluconate utilization system Gnt-I transcriptional repressor